MDPERNREELARRHARWIADAEPFREELEQIGPEAFREKHNISRYNQRIPMHPAVQMILDEIERGDSEARHRESNRIAREAKEWAAWSTFAAALSCAIGVAGLLIMLGYCGPSRTP